MCCECRRGLRSQSSYGMPGQYTVCFRRNDAASRNLRDGLQRESMPHQDRGGAIHQQVQSVEWQGVDGRRLGCAMARGTATFPKMAENPVDHRRLGDAGEHFDRTAAVLTRLDVDLEYAFQTSCPGHHPVLGPTT